MIAFSCAQCGMKLKVKPEFAGRASRCPTCKSSLTVPQPSAVQQLPEGEIDGTSSSLHQAGVEGGVSLDRPEAAPSQKPIQELLARRTTGQRYVVDREVARGGMGAIVRAVDCDIRREVAIKYLLNADEPRNKLRFMEEAQITGQLEHPNIVPIHELGIDGQKRLYFSMKMVSGRSLAEVLRELRKNTKEAEREYSLGRLLRIFIGICHPVAYAHARGVIHRDLKPHNVMLGDFGEVYVMDWGLAKVLKGTAPQPAGDMPNVSVSTSRSGKVDTSRAAADADLTQDGAVLGTPVYMPPEQASGHVDEINQRSDIYSLGAILYEILTLSTPVSKEGSYLDVIMRVMKGEIEPPIQRVRQAGFFRRRKVPRELSAVAMKALAKRQEDRYQCVDELRRDIERFQEGRSVSAKHDSLRELTWKLLKRNGAVSLVTSVALVLITVLWVRSALASHQEQKARREKAVPAFIEAAHFAVDRKKFDNALVQVSTAVEYDPERTDARLFKAQLLIVNGDYGSASRELQQYLQMVPKDPDAAALLELCRRGNPSDAATVAAIAAVFRRQNAISLAASMARSREDLLAEYRRQINAAWPGVGAGLDMDKDGNCTLSIAALDRDKVADLSPLHGIPLISLSIGGCTKVRDLGPLQGMPLTALNLDSCSQIVDLTPLYGMNLTSLNLRACRGIKDFTILKTMPLTTLSLTECEQFKDMKSLEGLKLTSLNLAWCREIREVSPLRGMPLVTLSLLNCNQFRDAAALHGLPVTTLDLQGCGQINDLSFLKDMKVRSLNLAHNNSITDLGPLRGLGLNSLRLIGCNRVKDLTPLQGLPLTTLDLQNCGEIRDLSPLKGMKLTTLNLVNCSQVHDLTPLQGMPLTDVYLTPKYITQGINTLRSTKSIRMVGIGGGPGTLFSAEQFWKRYDAGEFK
jgi:serine/threonine protein kinase